MPWTCSTGDSCDVIVADVAEPDDDETADVADVVDGRPDIDQTVRSAVTNSEIGESTYRDRGYRGAIGTSQHEAYCVLESKSCRTQLRRLSSRMLSDVAR